MLPSTGLFKSIICPYFENGSCTRPYCHYKHAKKDEKLEENKQATYTPAPKVPKPTLLTLGDHIPPVSKKSKLEYVPTKPEINDAPHTKDYTPKTEEIPIYIPSNTIKTVNSDIDDFNDSQENFMDESVFSDKEREQIVENNNLISSNVNNHVPNNIMDIDSDNTTVPKVSKKDAAAKSKLTTTTNEIENKSTKEHRHSKPDRSNSSSHRSSRHKDSHKDRKHHRSSSHHKKSSSSEKSSRHEHKSSSSRHSSSSRKSSSHKSSSKGKEKDKSKDRDKEKTDSSLSSASSSHSKSSRHRSTSSSKSLEKSSLKRKSSNDEIPISSAVSSASPSSIFDYGSEDEDIMEKCKQIFEEFSTNSNTETENITSSTSKVIKPSGKDTSEEDIYEDKTKKKRIAHENAINAKPISISQPFGVGRRNYFQDAMQSVYKRQEVLRKKQEDEAAAAFAAVKEAEEKLRQATEILKNTQNQLSASSNKNSVPQVKTSARTVAPVTNLLALEKARKRVEMLKATKLSLTPAQTTPKGAGRVAHKVTTETITKPAPPVLEPSSTKISYNLRMQYYNLMVKHCLIIYPSCEDAWDRAQTEELAVFKKCSTPIIYKSSALLTVNKLRKEAINAGNKCAEKNKTVSHEVILAGKLAQTSSWSIKNKSTLSSSQSGDPFEKLSGVKLYELFYECRLTEKQLKDNGFPRAGKNAGTAIISTQRAIKPPKNDDRYCSRCGKVFNISIYETVAIDECNYHRKSTQYRRGFADNLHQCCQQPAGTPGCTYANYHVSDYIDMEHLTGFVTTIDRDDDYVPTKRDIFALDCEMCYTTHGIELTRITVVDINGKVAYDSLVQPDNKIIDYNTVYSGITESMLANEKRNLRDIQAILLSMFNSKTILIGHSLESDLKALKLIHDVVIDTTVLFPHKMGPPKKRALKTLCIEYLKRIIQENDSGHDSAEDAEVCIQLVKYYLRNRIS